MATPNSVNAYGLRLTPILIELEDYIEEVFADYNDINDDTRMQLELINQTLAELQAKKKLEEKPRRRIGFIQHGE